MATPRPFIAAQLSLFAVALCSGCQYPQFAPLDPIGEKGCVLLLPGVGNLPVEMTGLADLIKHTYPGLSTHVQPWGPPLASLYNLGARQTNRQNAARMAAHVTTCRRAHPDAIIDVVGFSGGGGWAAFLVEALPDGVNINRLILIAAGLSREYPLESAVLPHVREFIVIYASPVDLQVGLGTQLLGTMDGPHAASIGSTGSPVRSPKVVQKRWELGMLKQLHFGNHTSYMSTEWQRVYVLPALDPAMNAERLRTALGAD